MTEPRRRILVMGAVLLVSALVYPVFMHQSCDMFFSKLVLE
jgi:hypothetical protein